MLFLGHNLVEIFFPSLLTDHSWRFSTRTRELEESIFRNLASSNFRRLVWLRRRRPIYLRYESFKFTICNHFLINFIANKNQFSIAIKSRKKSFSLRSQAVQPAISRFCRSTRMSTMTLRVSPSRADAHVVAAKFSNDFLSKPLVSLILWPPFFPLGGHRYLYYRARRELLVNSKNFSLPLNRPWSPRPRTFEGIGRKWTLSGVY